MVSGVPHDKFEIIEAIHKKRGVITHAAALLRIDFQNIYNWMDRDPEVAQAVIDAREKGKRERMDADEAILNMAYDSIQDLVRGRDVTATIFALKSKAKWSDKAGDEMIAPTTKIETVNYYQAKDG